MIDNQSILASMTFSDACLVPSKIPDYRPLDIFDREFWRTADHFGDHHLRPWARFRTHRQKVYRQDPLLGPHPADNAGRVSRAVVSPPLAVARPVAPRPCRSQRARPAPTMSDTVLRMSDRLRSHAQPAIVNTHCPPDRRLRGRIAPVHAIDAYNAASSTVGSHYDGDPVTDARDRQPRIARPRSGPAHDMGGGRDVAADMFLLLRGKSWP
jgi:hypothetical protein